MKISTVLKSNGRAEEEAKEGNKKRRQERYKIFIYMSLPVPLGAPKDLSAKCYYCCLLPLLLLLLYSLLLLLGECVHIYFAATIFVLRNQNGCQLREVIHD